MTRSDEPCAFCGKVRGEVARMVTGTSAAICNECIELCWDILSEPSERRGGQAIAHDRAMRIAGRKYKDALAGVDADHLESFVTDAIHIARDPPLRALRDIRFWLGQAGPRAERGQIIKVQEIVDAALADEPAPTGAVCVRCGHALDPDE